MIDDDRKYSSGAQAWSPRLPCVAALFHAPFLNAVLAALAIACLSLFSGQALAGKEFAPFGGSGDSSQTDRCKPGQYMVGVSLKTGLWWDAVQIVCAEALAGEKLGKASTSGQRRGGLGGGLQTSYKCPGDHVMNGVYIVLTKQRQVAWADLECTPNPNRVIKSKGARTAGSQFAEGQRQRQTCPFGEAAKGLRTNFGEHVNALGLICDAFVVPAAAPPPAGASVDDQRKEEMRVTGKNATQCQESHGRCTARVLSTFGPIQGAPMIAIQCTPFLQQCLANAAASQQALEAQRKEETRVTGKTVEQCIQSNMQCEARTRAQVGMLLAPQIIAAQCTPFFQQCMANAGADLAAADKQKEEQAEVQDAGGPVGTSPCRIPGGPATVRIDNPDVEGLNVRDKPNGQVLTILPAGTRVEVVGGCGSRRGAGFAANKPGQGSQGGALGWCAIAEPLVGCVADRFLAAGKPAAGFAAEPDPEQEPEPDLQPEPGPAPERVTTSRCDIPPGTATVSIEDPDIDTLNVRDKPNGRILTQIDEGSQVEVVGGCGSRLGAGFAANKPGQGGIRPPAGWCAISEPTIGCVHQQFLISGTPKAADKPAAGFAASRSAFSGRWIANAQGSSYNITLNQTGGDLTGSYTADDGSEGEIEGEVRGNTARFRWTQSDGLRGAGKFTLSESGRQFRGSFTLSNNPDKVDGPWNGRKR